MQSGVSETECLMLTGRTAQDDARADGAVFAEDIFGMAFKEDTPAERETPILCAREFRQFGRKLFCPLREPGKFGFSWIFQGGASFGGRG